MAAGAGCRPTAVALALTASLWLPAARAEGLSGYAEWTYTRNDSTTAELPAEPVDTLSRGLRQRYNLDWDRRLFPNLQVLVGGQYEAERSRSEQSRERLDSRNARFRPYAMLRLRTPLFVADLGWSRVEERSRTGETASPVLVRESYSASLGWWPENLPRTRLFWVRSEDHDSTRRVRDAEQNTVQLVSSYQPVRQIALNYRGSFLDADDRLSETSTRSQQHSLRASYAGAFWDHRLSFGADYNAQYRSTGVRSGGAGEVVQPLYPATGLSAIDDTPDEGVLEPNPALIDEELSAGAGVDLGLPPAGGNRRPRNLGLDFRVGTDLNTLYVWVDRELRAEIAAYFSWEVWTSEDGLRWTRWQTVPVAPFGPFQNRFEVRFRDVTARFVKLVVMPLDAAVAGAVDYPNILVTELQSAMRTNASEVVGRTVSNGGIGDLNVRYRILESPLLYYELTGYYNRSGNVPASWTVSNGFLLNHAFGPVWSATSRVAREEGRLREARRTAYVYSASVAAAPLPALHHNLTFSGNEEENGDVSTRQESVYLNSYATFYPGVDFSLAAGKSHTTTETRRDVVGTLWSASLALAPHPRATFNLSWQARTDDARGGDLVRSMETYNRAAEVSAALRPIETLYAYAAYRRDSSDDQTPQSGGDFAVSWTPFPEGSLHLNLAYSETYRTESASLVRTFTPSLRWTIRGGSILDVAYQRLQETSSYRRQDTRVVTASLRVAI